MKLRNKIALAISASLMTSAVTAATMDFRHEWKSVDHKESSRLKLGENYNINDDWKGNIGLEMKFASFDNTKTFEDIYLTETELDIGFTYKVNKNWELKPGMPIALTSRKTTLKPQLRVVHKADMGLTTALRYRLEVANYSNPTDGDTNMETGQKINDPLKTKLTLTGAYKVQSLPNLRLSYEANYIKSHDDVRQFDNKDYNYDGGIIVGYQLGDWRPYAELWDSSVASDSDQRQIKYRVGVNYRF